MSSYNTVNRTLSYKNASSFFDCFKNIFILWRYQEISNHFNNIKIQIPEYEVFFLIFYNSIVGGE